ncbi:hypothetical protein M422DRAFT_57963 [Sphaerobolus stellatus SS14]|nr:hypothetical protein M422DRAFT_57963 [Sphaerobolus stellatus SS14]
MPHAPLPVVSSRDPDDAEAECPVCLEPLSFSFRLPGEKPHIVPECGHALHEACFAAVYGPPPGARGSNVPRKANLGVCGVCRRPMKVADGDGGKSNKLAALTGVVDRSTSSVYPGRPNPQRNGRNPTPAVYDPNEDDPIESSNNSVRSGNSGGQQSSYIVAPSITVKPEFSTITRTSDPTQPLTCIVTIELPSRRAHSHVPGPVIDHTYPVSPPPAPPHPSHHSPHASQNLSDRSDTTIGPNSHRRPLSNESSSYSAPYSYNATPAPDSPFAAITEDLRNRIIDWKGHPLSGLGSLQMYDLLSVRRDSLVREFYVYLFREAIICVIEEKKRSLGRLLSSAASDVASLQQQSKGVLRLKGRVYIRHVKQVTETSIAGELSLTIDMEDERLESFILIFRDRSSLETWRNAITDLVAATRVPQVPPPSGPSLSEFGAVPSKAQRMLSGSTATVSDATSQADSLLAQGSSRSTLSSSTSQGPHPNHHNQHSHQPQGQKYDEYMHHMSPPTTISPHLSSGPSNSLHPLPHTPIDLILVISLPPPNASPSTAALKNRVIKASLDFIVASLGSKDRLSIVTFEVGMGGRVRKTPFLCPGRNLGRTRLGRFIEGIGAPRSPPPLPPHQQSQPSSQPGTPTPPTPGPDEFVVRTSRDEKTDVVTAVNHALDVVLQRKTRNAISGMMLVSDASDSTRRAQMDLVLARAEAANVPIHSFGYGRSHDPASLWLMSNHTSGTYTFVKDWYDLRDCLAGCIGGMMSVGLLHMKMHMKVVDGRRFRIRKVSGGPSSIVSSDGCDVDVEVGEVRYGERKEMLVEVELDNAGGIHGLGNGGSNGNPNGASNGGGGGYGRNTSTTGVGPRNGARNATEQYVASMGLDLGGEGDLMNLMEGMMEGMIDEVPVFEVDGSFYDPAAGKQVSRLAHPVLLTVTLLPAPPTPQHQHHHHNGRNAPPPAPAPNPGQSDAVIVRRRMELLASDMITRALVLVSRKNTPAAQKILSETKRILHTVLQSISARLPPPSSFNGNSQYNNSPNAQQHQQGPRPRKEALLLSAVRALQSILADIQVLSEALAENTELFAHDQRNLGAQQAMILRDQKSWSGRTPVEKLFWTVDNSIELVGRSTDWVVGE